MLVPAKGIERWLSQRLSHRLGPAPGREDGVCAGVQFRSPASLVAEVTGTRDDDPVGARRAGLAAAARDRPARRRGVVPHPEPAPRPRPGGRGGRAAARPPLRRGPSAGPPVRVVRRPAAGAAERVGGGPGHRRCRRGPRPRPDLAVGALAPTRGRARPAHSPPAAPRGPRDAGLQRRRRRPAATPLAVRAHPDRRHRGGAPRGDRGAPRRAPVAAAPVAPRCGAP